MMCTRCRELEEENRHLKRELGYEVERRVILALARSLRIRPQMARFLAILHRHAGQFVTPAVIYEALGTESEQPQRLAATYKCLIRAKIGFDALETVQGLGVRLTPKGKAIIDRALGGLDVAA